MSPKMIVSPDGVRYPADFAEKHGVKADREIETFSAADRTHTHAGLGVVTDDVAGSVVSSRSASLGLAAPEGTVAADPALEAARAAEAAGQGAVGTLGAPDNTTAGGATGESTTVTGQTETGKTEESEADNGGTTAGDTAGAGNPDEATAKRSTARASSPKGK